jgi:putative transposase
MDFMSDALADGRRFRLLNVVVDWTRECLAIEVGRSLTGRNVIAVLEKIAMRRGCPTAIVSDNDPEFCSRAVDEWAHRLGIKLQFIRPGKPVENAFIERFNGKCRDECLNERLFLTIEQGAQLPKPGVLTIIRCARIARSAIGPRGLCETCSRRKP